MDQILAPAQEGMDRLLELLGRHSQAAEWYTALVRFLFPVLALLILTRAIRGLLRVPHAAECWGQLALPGGGSIPILHWENILGRSPSADVRLDLPTVSRQHAALLRDDRGLWKVTDLGSKGGTLVNGRPVTEPIPIRMGDSLSVGGVELLFLPLSREEEEELAARRRGERPLSMWPSLLWLTLFQVLAAVQLTLSREKPNVLCPLVFLALSLVMWLYCLILRGAGVKGFEMETIAFFLSTLSLAVTGSSAPGAMVKQLAAVVLGLVLMVALGVWMRDTARIQKMRWLMAALALGLLSVTLVIGRTKFGAANWIILGPFSFQPSEVAKICYIFAGAAGLERLFQKRNLGLFMVMTGACLLCLALMSDFGTACIFFATFLVIAYLRSGDFATLSLVCGGALFAGVLVLHFKPYILRRFASWGHAWEAASTTGYQQTRAMSAAASGGLVGVGAGRGWLYKLPAADTDLVFGMLCEEWGLLIAVLAVLSILTLAVFAARSCRVGRSAFPTIAACAAGSLLVVQTGLNVFGAMDLLPLTGVTFPFLSNGGSAMMASWGLLAFLKATDTREGASFAIRRVKNGKKEASGHEED
ncbi:FtsW/RodA/SpoVE family cell cycle protein [Pseudoflavonifractor phocaeensis]|uniref:FtsW/RodA/SpoVE family cell cycle protein n=1 Tax=Pseudoflavonifractor phocaeensis TaxID=1870988 RepID=UPI001F45A4AA|nr:FtsW/RodA/SpoVE family cell cycle protein [Pseudoflavonifractor phocaeensis]MCF2662046.1 FtsW/RodA/SpoVE family cell cycle protein [Pseudoflavonifractor phocaeensis]